MLEDAYFVWFGFEGVGFFCCFYRTSMEIGQKELKYKDRRG